MLALRLWLAPWHVHAGYILSSLNLLGLVLHAVSAAKSGVWVSGLLDMEQACHCRPASMMLQTCGTSCL